MRGEREGKSVAFFLHAAKGVLHFLFEFLYSLSAPIIFILWRETTGRARHRAPASLPSVSMACVFSVRAVLVKAKSKKQRQRRRFCQSHLPPLSLFPIKFQSLRVHGRENVLLELPHHVPGLHVVADVEVGAAVEVGAELRVAAEARRALPEHLRGVARLSTEFFVCRFWVFSGRVFMGDKGMCVREGAERSATVQANRRGATERKS